MTTCASCGRENEAHYKYCLGCGANLDQQRSGSKSLDAPATPRFCPSCGSDVSSGQRFCGACGFKLESAATASAPPGDAPWEPRKSASAPHAPAADAPPSPAPAAAPQAGAVQVGALIMVNPDGTAGDSAPLFAGPNVVGRESAHEVLSRDPFLSPRHATFEVQGSDVTVVDEASLNGVYYRITDVTELQHGDHLRVGQELLRFLVHELCEPIVEPADDGTVLAGANPQGAWGRIERISAPDAASWAWMLRGSEIVIGRERGDILFRDDGYVSGKHARIFPSSGRYYVEDLRSSNGTFVRIRGRKTLASGALILMGRQPFRVQIG